MTWYCDERQIVGPDGKPTKKVDHARAVKIYERGQGDKIIPSDLRPAPILKVRSKIVMSIHIST